AAAIAAERLRHAVAEISLIAREEIDRSFEIARHDELHAVAVEADHLPEKIDRQKIRALILLLEDNLCENRAGNVLAGFRVEDHKVFAFLDHHRQIFERNVGARAGVVETPVGVFLDRDRFWFRHHIHYAYPRSPQIGRDLMTFPQCGLPSIWTGARI